MRFGHINRRGFYLQIGASMLSCHWNGHGYGYGSQIALNFGGQRTGSAWIGWWSDGGWGVRRQEPLRVYINGVLSAVEGQR